jgi:hypothetical protein
VLDIGRTPSTPTSPAQGSVSNPIFRPGSSLSAGRAYGTETSSGSDFWDFLKGLFALAILIVIVGAIYGANKGTLPQLLTTDEERTLAHRS